MPNHIVITYSAEKASQGHVDPNFTQLVYGDGGHKGDVLKKHLESGSYLFFNARIGQKRYITAYFYVDKILLKGEDAAEIEALTCSAKEDAVIIIGNRSFSKVLTVPLDLDHNLMTRLHSFQADDVYFDNKEARGIGELEAIKDKTLNPTVISNEEKEFLLDLCTFRG